MTHKLIKTEKYLLITEHHNQYNILAHLPLNGSPILKGVDLLPPIEDYVDKLATNYVTEDGKYKLHDDADRELSSFIAGYKKAREKYKYTEEDVRKAITMVSWQGQDLVWEHEYDDILQSLHLSPTEFECEMEHVPHPPPSRGFSVVPKTITTSQGIQWVGKYK